MAKALSELDALVAEKVMGWRVTPHPDLHGATYFEVPDGTATVMPDMFSTDIAAAWTVVEKMRADGWGFGFGTEEGGGWAAIFANGRDGMAFEEYEEGYSFEAAAPLAICRAALKAVRVQAVPTSDSESAQDAQS